MDWVSAFKHMMIGYGIRRKGWPEGLIAHINEDGMTIGYICRTANEEDEWFILNEAIESLRSSDWETI